MADLRDDMPDLSRAEFDAELRQMDRERVILLFPQANQKILSDRQREGAINIGGQDNHVLLIEPSQMERLRPGGGLTGSSSPPRGRIDAGRVAGRGVPAGVVDRLRAAGSPAQAREAIAGLTVPQLRAVATEVGAPVGAGWRKPQIQESIVQRTTARSMLDAMMRGVGRGR